MRRTAGAAGSPCERVLAVASGPLGSHQEGRGALFWTVGRPSLCPLFTWGAVTGDQRDRWC